MAVETGVLFGFGGGVQSRRYIMGLGVVVELIVEEAQGSRGVAQ